MWFSLGSSGCCCGSAPFEKELPVRSVYCPVHHMGGMSVKNSVFAITVFALTALALPALGAESAEAGAPGQTGDTGQPDAGASSSSKKGYDYYQAKSDMSSKTAGSRAPAGVTHEYHRTSGACTGDADCDGRGDDDGTAKATGGSTQSPSR